MCLDYSGLYYALFCCKYTQVFTYLQNLLFCCSLGSATCNQPTTMLMGFKAVRKGMLLLKISHQSYLDGLGLLGIISIEYASPGSLHSSALIRWRQESVTENFSPWRWQFLMSGLSPESPMCSSTLRIKCTISVNSTGAFFCIPISGAQHDPPMLQLMLMEHGYPLPQHSGGIDSLGCCPVEWWCCGWGGSSFFFLSPRPCSSLNPSAACHYTGSPVICFITMPGQGQFNPRFSELRRLTEKSMCWSKERSRSSRWEKE